MDHDEDRNDNAGNQPSTSQSRDEETGETERGTFSQHRANEEQFASDEDSNESVGNGSRDESSHDDTDNIDYSINCINEYIKGIPDLLDLNEKNSCSVGTVRPIQEQENEDLTAKLNEITLNDESSECQNSIKDDSEKLNLLPDVIKVSYNSSSMEFKWSPSQKYRSLYPELSDYHSQNLESTAENEEISSMASQASMSQHSRMRTFKLEYMSRYSADVESSALMDFRSPDPGTSSMGHSPTRPTITNLENAQSLEAPPNFNTSHRPDPQIPQFSSSSTSFDRMPLSLPISDYDNLPIALRNTSHACKSFNSSRPNIHTTQEYQEPNKCLSLSSSGGNTTNEHHSPNSDIHKERLLRSCEEPRTSTRESVHKIYQCSKSCSRCNDIFRNRTTLSDLPSTSDASPHRSSLRLPQYPTHASKSARKLNFNSDTSSDDSEEKNSPLKETLVRKFSENDEPRKKRKTSHLSKSSNNHSTLPKTGNDEDGSENSRFSPSRKKSSKTKDSESVSTTLCSSETVNSETFEANQSSRKRLISDSKASDSDESDVKEKQKKKLKKQYDPRDGEKN